MHSAHTTHRSKYEIANDILRIVSEDPAIRWRHKTGIGYAARLTHWFMVRYLRGLTNEVLLRSRKDAGPYHQHYEITSKGLRYLQLYAELEDDLRPVDSVTS